jgi:hypothetical protein
MTTPNPLLSAALAYAKRGWSVLPLHYPTADGCSCGRPCKTPGKHPFARLVARGSLDATTNPNTITDWWTRHPLCNIGVATGSLSQLLVIDLDDRPMDGRDGSHSWRRLVTLNHAVDTVEAITGGGGRHLYFSLPSGLTVAQSKDAIGLGVEVKSDGGYVVAPPSLHPSQRTYEWDAFGHPDDQPVEAAPQWLLSLCHTRAPRISTDTERPAGALDALEIAELQSALAAIAADDRDVWIEVGMALHATNDDAQAYPLFDQWSSTSAKYQGASDTQRTYDSFRHRPEGRTLASLYHRAALNGWVRPSLESLLRTAGYAVPDLSLLLQDASRATLVAPTDPLVHALPGHIETIAAWSYQGAARPSHVYAVAAALALASVLTGRRYCTSTQNYSALYFLAVGKSGTGKEHIRTTVESVLRALDQYNLIGLNSVKSDSGLFSAVYDAPQSIAIVDEFGQYLEAASGRGEAAAMKDTVLTTMMELWGRVAGIAQTPQYATLALSSKAKEDAKKKFIDRPSWTFVGLSTPDAFFAALKSRRIASGFLNRFLTLQHSGGRMPFSMAASTEPPQAVIDWGRQLLAPRNGPDGQPMVLDALNRPTNIPPATVLHFPPASEALFRAFDQDCMAEADRLESERLGELPMRANEQAMRLALMAALSDDPHATHISPQFATWGIDVARWALAQLVPSVIQQMADTPIHALRNAFLQMLREAGADGVSEYELKRARLFAGVSRQDRKETIDWAQDAGHAHWDFRPVGARGGRPTRCLRLSQVFDGFHNSEAA